MANDLSSITAEYWASVLSGVYSGTAWVIKTGAVRSTKEYEEYNLWRRQKYEAEDRAEKRLNKLLLFLVAGIMILILI